MALIDLQYCEGASDPLSGSPVHLLRVILFNLSRALEAGHVSEGSASDVLSDLMSSPLLTAGDLADVHIDEVYNELSALLVRWGPIHAFAREDEITSFTTCKTVTYQPSWAFIYWVDSGEARKRVHSAADIATLVSQFGIPRLRIPSANVGAAGDVVWLTPETGPIGLVLEAAWQIQQTADHARFDKHGFADDLRTLLGLARRKSPERAVALVLTQTLDQLQGLARAQPVNGRRSMSAPTQYEARDYPRFRHWPGDPADPEGDLGRTWALNNPVPGAGVSEGAPEFVCSPFPTKHVKRIVSLGPIRSKPMSAVDAILADQAFADDVCGGETLIDLLDQLGARLGL